MSEQIEYINPSEINPDPTQPRSRFDDEEIRLLAETYNAQDVINPIEVDENNIIILGERRWRAAILEGLTKIPVRRKIGLSLKERLERQLIDDAQRKELIAQEKVWAYATGVVNINTGKNYTIPEIKQLWEDHPENLNNYLGLSKGGRGIKLGTAQLARTIGVSQNNVSMHLMYFKVSSDIRRIFDENGHKGERSKRVTISHIAEIARLSDYPEEQAKLEKLFSDDMKNAEEKRKYRTMYDLRGYVTKTIKAIKEAAVKRAKELEEEQRVEEEPVKEPEPEEEDEEEIEEEEPEPPEPEPTTVESEAEKILREKNKAREKAVKKLYKSDGAGQSLEGKIESARGIGVKELLIQEWEDEFTKYDEKDPRRGDFTKEQLEQFTGEIQEVISKIDAAKRGITNEETARKKIEEARSGGVSPDKIAEFEQQLNEMIESLDIGNNKKMKEFIGKIGQAIHEEKVRQEKDKIREEAESDIDEEDFEAVVTEDPDKTESVLLYKATEGLSKEDRQKLFDKAEVMGWGASTTSDVKDALKDMNSSVRNIILSDESRLSGAVVIKLAEVEVPKNQEEILQRIRTQRLNRQDALDLIQLVLEGKPPQDVTVVQDDVDKFFRNLESLYNSIWKIGYNHYQIIGEGNWAKARDIFSKIEERMRWLKNKAFLSDTQPPQAER